MTRKTALLPLFASSVAATLGAVIMVESLPISGRLMVVGIALAATGTLAFLRIGSQLEKTGPHGPAALIATALAGVACVWFWTGPARTAGLTASCLYGDKMPACALVVGEGGFAAEIVERDMSWQNYRCSTRGDCRYLKWGGEPEEVAEGEEEKPTQIFYFQEGPEKSATELEIDRHNCAVRGECDPIHLIRMD